MKVYHNPTSDSLLFLTGQRWRVVDEDAEELTGVIDAGEVRITLHHMTAVDEKTAVPYFLAYLFLYASEGYTKDPSKPFSVLWRQTAAAAGLDLTPRPQRSEPARKREKRRVQRILDRHAAGMRYAYSLLSRIDVTAGEDSMARPVLDMARSRLTPGGAVLAVHPLFGALLESKHTIATVTPEFMRLHNPPSRKLRPDTPETVRRLHGGAWEMLTHSQIRNNIKQGTANTESLGTLAGHFFLRVNRKEYIARQGFTNVIINPFLHLIAIMLDAGFLDSFDYTDGEAAGDPKKLETWSSVGGIWEVHGMAEVQKTLTGKKKNQQAGQSAAKSEDTSTKTEAGASSDTPKKSAEAPRTVAKDTGTKSAEAPRKAQTVEATAKTVTREQGEPVGEVAAETSEQVHDVPEATPRAKTFTGMEARQAPQTGPQGAEASAAGQSLDDSAGEAVSVNGVEMVIDGVPRPSAQAVGIQKVQIDEGLLESTKTRRRTQTKEESDPFRR